MTAKFTHYGSQIIYEIYIKIFYGVREALRNTSHYDSANSEWLS